MSSETHACHENLSKLVSALTPGSSNYAFVGSFLNATPESVRARDTAIPPKLWDEQMERLEREGLQIQGILWPTKVMGPEVLPQRLKQQNESVVECLVRAQEVEADAKQVHAYGQNSIPVLISRIKVQNAKLESRLLLLAHNIQALQLKGKEKLLTSQELDTYKKLLALMDNFSSKKNSLKSQAQEVCEASRVLKLKAKGSGGLREPELNANAEQVENLKHFLMQTNRDIAGLKTTLGRAANTVQVMANELNIGDSKKRTADPNWERKRSTKPLWSMG